MDRSVALMALPAGAASERIGAAVPATTDGRADHRRASNQPFEDVDAQQREG